MIFWLLLSLLGTSDIISQNLAKKISYQVSVTYQFIALNSDIYGAKDEDFNQPKSTGELD